MTAFGVLVAACSDPSTAPSPIERRSSAGRFPELVSSPQNDVVPGRYIVRFKSGLPDAASRTAVIKRQHGIRTHLEWDGGLIDGFSATLTDSLVQILRRRPDVQDIEPVMRGYAGGEQTQYQLPNWGIDRIDQRALPLSNSYTYWVPAPTNIWVFDTGINSNHTDLVGRVMPAIDMRHGQPRIGLTSGDPCGHGTAVAAIAGGTNYGVTKDAWLLDVAVMACDYYNPSTPAYTYTDWVLAGLSFVYNNRDKSGFSWNPDYPDVINMSLSFNNAPQSFTIDQAVRTLVMSGVVVVVNSGNDATDACTSVSPARVAEVLTVAATDRNDVAYARSNSGSCVDLYAPGVDIMSATRPDWAAPTHREFAVWTGTSFAAPHVAGVAAQFFAGNPSAAAASIQAAILDSATRNVVLSPRPGIPNRLLFSRVTGRR